MQLVLGHPRGGTGFAAACLGLGHEKVNELGTANWMWAVQDSTYPWGDQRGPGFFAWTDVVHVFRDPLGCILSTAFTDGPSLAWRRTHVSIAQGTALEMATESYLQWHKLIRRNWPEARTTTLLHLPNPNNVGKVNTREHPKFSEEVLLSYLRPRWRLLYYDATELYDRANQAHHA